MKKETIGISAVTPSSRRSRSSGIGRRRARWLVVLLAAIWVLPATVGAQEYELFDKFSIAGGAGWNSVDTTVRLDSKRLGLGTVINFEGDTQLDSSKVIPDLSFEWRVGKRHLVSGHWGEINRSNTTPVSRELQFGDLEIPVDATVRATYDLQAVRLGYTYYPILKDRVAFGIAGGLRVLDIQLGITIEGTLGESDLAGSFETADVTGPLPFVGVDVRYGVSPKWRMQAGAALFDVTVGDVSGFQAILGANIENLVTTHFSWGLQADYSVVDIDVEDDDFIGKADLDIGFLRFFVKGRW